MTNVNKSVRLSGRQLKVLQVTEATLPGGTLNTFVRRAVGFAHRGHEVRAVVSESSAIDGSVHRMESEGIRVVRGSLGNLSPRAAWRALSFALSDYYPEVAIVELPTLTSSKLLPLLIRRLGVPNVIAVVQLPAFADGSRWRRLLDSTTKSFNFSQCDRVVAVSESAASRVRELIGPARHAADPTVIVNGVDLPGQRRPRRRENATPFRILSTGMFVEQKDHVTILEAASQLSKKGTPVHFVFAGEGPLRPNLERRRSELGLNEVVSMPGFQADMQKELASADISVLASRFEGCPLAVLESFAAEVPVVVSSAKGNLDLVRHEQNGLVFEVGDPAGLAEAIERLTSDADLVRFLTANGRDDVEQKYQTTRMLDEYERVCAEVIEQTHRGIGRHRP